MNIKVGILGATGMVGQRFVELLDGHPWFEVTALAASDQSAGKPYAEACQWIVSPDMPEAVREMTVQPCQPELDCELVFSSLPASVAGEIEEAFAAAGTIVSSNARNHRMAPDVPLLIPEVNPAHLGLIPRQQRERGWDRGFIITNPNCSTIHLVLALKPLQDHFGLRRVAVVTMQALSGAGYPGVPSLAILDNVVPYIGGEEPKVETEPLKLLGHFDGRRIIDADFTVSAQCNRVSTFDGHVECVSVELEREATLEEVAEALAGFRAEPQELGLPSAPEHPIVLRPEIDRPQPRLDRDLEKGMASVVGRLRPCPILGYKFVVLGHNTIRGAAGAAILNAELLVAKGYLGEKLGSVAAGQDVVRLDRRLAEEMIAHARQGAPEEVCGILAGAEGHLTRLYRMRNVADNPVVTYHMDPHEQLRVFQEIEDDRGWEIAGIYHSHPASPAYPSPTDMRLAFYPDAVYFIVSLARPDAPIIRAFCLDQEEDLVTEQKLIVV